MDILRNFPYLIPFQTPDSSHIYDGYIHINNDEFRVKVSFPNGPAGSSEIPHIECEWRLRCLLSEHQDVILQRLKRCSDPATCLKELTSVLESVVETKPKASNSASSLSRRIVDEMENIGWEKLLDVDASFQNLTLQCEDSGGRRHTLIVRLSPQDSTPPQCVTDLPEKFSFQWSNKGHLSDLVRQFGGVLGRYQAFWDAVASVDGRTWVLEPDTPTFSACTRRIALSPGTSLHITVDPRHPSSMPECRFLGADQIINPLKEKLNANIHLWDNSQSLVCNLEALLGVTFPSPTNSKKEDFSLECGICYSYRLGDEIPDKACDDAHCGQPFHHSCLSEWMRSLPSCQQSFNTIFGECPFCSKPITIKLPTK